MSDVNLTLQDNGGVYLAITETPAVVTLGQAVISGALASTVTVANVVSVNVVTMPAINITPAAVTTVAGTVSISNFPASSSVTIANFPSVTTVTGTVALDQASLIALENVTVTVGSTISISNLPATQTIAGTVTANTYNGLNWIYVAGSFNYSNGYDTTPTLYLNTYFKRVSEYRWESFNYIANEDKCTAYIIQEQDNYDQGYWRLYVNYEGLSGPVGIASGILAEIALDSPNIYSKFPPQNGWGIRTDLGFTGSVSVNYIQPETYQSQITNSVTIGSLPAISGTVTANVTNSVTVGSLPVQLSTTTIGGTSRLNVTLSSATTVGATAPSYGNLSGGSDGTNFRAILTDTSGRTVVTISNFPATQPVSLASLPSLAAGTAQIGSVTASISGTVPVSGTFWQATQPVSGTVTAAVASTTVTVSAMPSGTLTTRFGTPTTANTAFLTSAVTNTVRKYLLIQNVTTASNVITVGVGFVPTTTQGIQLAAGAGITFESSYIPTGAVWVLSSVTASNHTILEA